jgi:hypothetical protein
MQHSAATLLALAQLADNHDRVQSVYLAIVASAFPTSVRRTATLRRPGF